jgi:hypothetical protein
MTLQTANEEIDGIITEYQNGDYSSFAHCLRIHLVHPSSILEALESCRCCYRDSTIFRETQTLEESETDYEYNLEESETDYEYNLEESETDYEYNLEESETDYEYILDDGPDSP